MNSHLHFTHHSVGNSFCLFYHHLSCNLLRILQSIINQSWQKSTFGILVFICTFRLPKRLILGNSKIIILEDSWKSSFSIIGGIYFNLYLSCIQNLIFTDMRKVAILAMQKHPKSNVFWKIWMEIPIRTTKTLPQAR